MAVESINQILEQLQREATHIVRALRSEGYKVRKYSQQAFWTVSWPDSQTCFFLLWESYGGGTWRLLPEQHSDEYREIWKIVRGAIAQKSR